MEIPKLVESVPQLYLRVVNPPRWNDHPHPSTLLSPLDLSLLLVPLPHHQTISNHGFDVEEARGRGRLHHACHSRRFVRRLWRCPLRVSNFQLTVNDSILTCTVMIPVPLVASWA